jgi:hypothetical protein
MSIAEALAVGGIRRAKERQIDPIIHFMFGSLSTQNVY